MFRIVPLSIIRSFSLHTQQWYMSYRFADGLRAGSGLSANMYDIYHCCVHSENLLMMDRRTVRNVQNFIPKINLRNQCMQLVLIQEFITMHSHLNVKFLFEYNCGLPVVAEGMNKTVYRNHVNTGGGGNSNQPTGAVACRLGTNVKGSHSFDIPTNALT